MVIAYTLPYPEAGKVVKCPTMPGRSGWGRGELSRLELMEPLLFQIVLVFL